MLVWRGHGIYVIFLAVLAAALSIGPCMYLAETMFPDRDISFDMLNHTTPYVGYAVGGVFLVFSFIVWRIGRRVNDGHNEHTLFFIPFQFWAFIFLGIAGVGVAMAVSGSDIEDAKKSFVEKCVEYEEDTGPAECGCWADAISDNASEAAQLPFYLFLANKWGASDTVDEDVFPDFMAQELTLLDEVDQETFFTAMDASEACFADAEN